MKPSTAKWYSTNRARFDSDESFRAWMRDRKTKWRRANPEKAKASSMRHAGRIKQKAQQKSINDVSLVLWAMMQRMKYGKRVYRIRVPRFKRVSFNVVIKTVKVCVICGVKHTRQSECCSPACWRWMHRKLNPAIYFADLARKRKHSTTHSHENQP